MNKLLELFMATEFNFAKENNTTVGKKFNCRFTLTQFNSPKLFSLIDQLFKQHDSGHVEYLTLKTFLRIVQNKYLPGDPIVFRT